MSKYGVEHEGKQYEVDIVRTDRKNKWSVVTDFISGRGKNVKRESLQRELQETVKNFEDVYAENISYLIQSREGIRERFMRSLSEDWML